MKLKNPIYLAGALDEDTSLPVIEALVESANLGHDADLVILTPGGAADVGVALAEVIRALPILTHAWVVGCCDSAGVPVAAACAHVTVSPTTSMLLHAAHAPSLEEGPATYLQLEMAQAGLDSTIQRYLSHLEVRLEADHLDVLRDVLRGVEPEMTLVGSDLVRWGLADELLAS